MSVERELLAAMFDDISVVTDVAKIIAPEDLPDDEADLFRILKEVSVDVESGPPPLSLISGKIQNKGKRRRLVDLAAEVASENVPSFNARLLAKQIAKESHRQKLQAHILRFKAAVDEGKDFGSLFQDIQGLMESGPMEKSGVLSLSTRWPVPINLSRLAETDPEPPKFLMQDWLPCGYATLFAGHGGVGKSALALVLAVCIAMGIPFFGLPVERRRVLYLSCEDRGNVLHWRLSRICAFLGISIADLHGWLEVLDLVGHDVILYKPGRDGSPLTNSYHQLSRRMAASSIQALFVDGITDTYDGNENARAEVKAYVNAILALIPPDDGALVLVGHVSKPAANTKTTEGYSGTTAWHNAVRARWYLYPEVVDAGDYGRGQRSGDLMLELQKSNMGPTDRAMRFSWQDDAGMFIGHEVEEESHFDRNLREREEMDGIIAALLASPDYVPAASSGQRTAYHVLSAQPGFPSSLISGNAARRRFWQLIEKLRAMGAIAEDSITRTSDRKKVRVIKPGKASPYAGND